MKTIMTEPDHKGIAVGVKLTWQLLINQRSKGSRAWLDGNPSVNHEAQGWGLASYLPHSRLCG